MPPTTENPADLRAGPELLPPGWGVIAIGLFDC
jgi:hypothetical protein